MTDQQQRVYASLLKWYPRRWRDRNGEAFVGVLLDEAEARGSNSVTLNERARISATGLRMRLTPRRGARELATAAILLGSLCWVLYLALISWSPGIEISGSIGPFSNPVVLAGVPWLLGMLANLFRQPQIARGAYLVSAATILGIGAVRLFLAPEWYGPSLSSVVAFSLLGIAAAMDRPVWRLASAKLVVLSAIGLVAAMFGVSIVEMGLMSGSPAVGLATTVAVLLAATVVTLGAVLARRQLMRRQRRASD